MVSVCKLGGTINQTGVKGGKSKRSEIPPQSLSFSFSPRPRFSRFATHHSSLVRSRDVPSIALKMLGKERDCSQSTEFLAKGMRRVLSFCFFCNFRLFILCNKSTAVKGITRVIKEVDKSSLEMLQCCVQ